MVRVGINGFGRTARAVVRSLYLLDERDVQIVAINSHRGSPELFAHLLQYDTVHGRFQHEVEAKDDSIIIEGSTIPVLMHDKPADIPWDRFDAEVVLECTGEFTEKESASKHLGGSVRNVIISAPSKDADATIVFGVNNEKFNPKEHRVISASSCTTNCLVVTLKVLLSFGISKAAFTTAHAYTTDQRLLDGSHRDLRRARSAPLVIAPTSSGAQRTVAAIFPELKGKIDGYALRVPTPDVSILCTDALLESKVRVEGLNSAFKEAADGKLRGILDYCEKPLVSSDFKSTTYSAIHDSLLTRVVDGNLAQVASWYDNEMGYSSRLIQLAKYAVLQQ